MRLDTHRSCLLAGVAVYLAVAAAAVAFAWGYVHAESGRVGRRALEVAAGRAALAEARDIMAGFEAEVATRQSNGVGPSALLPAEEQGEAFLKAVNTAASRHRVQVPSVQSQPIVRDGDIAKGSVQLECRGSFRALHAFLFDLEQGPVPVEVAALTVRREAAGSCAADITCVVYGR